MKKRPSKERTVPGAARAPGGGRRARGHGSPGPTAGTPAAGERPAQRREPQMASRRRPDQPGEPGGQPGMQLEGRHPVLEALRRGRRLYRLWVAEGVQMKGPVAEILELASARGLAVERCPRERLDALSDTGHHQGVIALAEPPAYVSVEEILARAEARKEPPLLLLLDGIQDPGNLGSLLRTAEAVGVHGVLIPKHGAVGLTPAVARASAGASEVVPVAQVVNLAAEMERLKAAGLWLVGADASGPEELWAADLTGPLGLVVGSEGRGLRRLVRDRCDRLVRIPMWGQIASLNAGVAGALLLYEARRQRSQASPH